MKQDRGQQVPAPPAELSRKVTAWALLRRRWPLAAVLFALLASGSAMVGGGGTAALAEAIADPLSLLDDRSPGGRPDGALFSTKPDRKVVRDAVDAVLPTAREVAPPMSDSPAPGVAAGPIPVPVPVEVFPVEAMPETLALGPPSGRYIGGSAPGILLPIGGGPGSPPGSGPPGTGNPPDPDTPVIPAVPEPSTWALLILGFFMVGATLRAKAGRAALRGAS